VRSASECMATRWCRREGNGEVSSRRRPLLPTRHGSVVRHGICGPRFAVQEMTPAQLAVRRAMVGDEHILRALRLEALAEAPEAFGSNCERELARTTLDWRRWLAPGVTLVLEDAGAARGLVAGVLDPQDPGIVYLMSMWIHPALRGSGAADVLVAEHLVWARAAGARSVRLDVFATNVRARRLYERHGFRGTGEQTVRDDGRLELRMELDLEQAERSSAL
jgi:ribosomal protein S18 acetylase RimI-like enzyme